MARPRKKRRTQQPGAETNARGAGVTNVNSAQRIPKSMVIRMGGSDVGSSVSQLVKDMRQVMEPHTASRLKERRGNKLRDFTTMAGPLGVSHLMLFYRAPSGNVNMKLAVAPRGPTFSFHVEKYSLAKDIAKSLKRPKTGSAGLDHFQPPLLVMNNFASPQAPQNDGSSDQANGAVPKHLESLTTSVFQSLFPPISPQKTPLSSIRRVLLVNRELNKDTTHDGTFVLNLRHYAISSKALVPLSRGLKRLQTAQRHATRRPSDKPAPDFAAGDPTQKQKARSARGGLPDMSRLDDVADYLLEPGAAGGYTSASESEMDMTDAEVEVVESQARRVFNRKERERRKQQEQASALAAAAEAKAMDDDDDGEEDEDAPRRGSIPQPTQKRALKLTEIGPRMRLRLYKVEEGLCAGKTLWHEVVSKSQKEERELERLWETRKREKEQRRQIQKENIERKKREKNQVKAEQKGNVADEDEDDDDEDGDEDQTMDGDWDDLEDEDMDDLAADEGDEEVEEE